MPSMSERWSGMNLTLQSRDEVLFCCFDAICRWRAHISLSSLANCSATQGGTQAEFPQGGPFKSANQEHRVRGCESPDRDIAAFRRYLIGFNSGIGTVVSRVHSSEHIAASLVSSLKERHI